MPKTSPFYLALITGTMISGTFGNYAFAADIADAPLPAVSAINGKIEIGAGYGDIDVIGDTGVFMGAASLSIPLGDTFGFQADVAVVDAFKETGFGGAGHLFTRDPNSYLLGAIGGYTDFGNADAIWGGAEAELYLDNISIELAGGYMGVNRDNGSDSGELFAFADIAFYATENFRLDVGARSVAGFETGSVGFEWMMDETPLSIKGTVRAGEDDFVAATMGVSYYFGGNEASKSLMRRHREDDPRNRVLDIFGSGAAAGLGRGELEDVEDVVPVVCDFDPETPLPPCEPT